MDLRSYGFRFPRSRLAKSAEEAVEFARELGAPVALKVVSPAILHKTDVGGVELELDSEEAVRAAFVRITRCVAENAPNAPVEGINGPADIGFTVLVAWRVAERRGRSTRRPARTARRRTYRGSGG